MILRKREQSVLQSLCSIYQHFFGFVYFISVLLYVSFVKKNTDDFRFSFHKKLKFIEHLFDIQNHFPYLLKIIDDC